MLTMVILGYSALREPARLEEFTGAAHGRSVETGAQIFVSNCASCHGIDGRAESGPESGCVDPASGEPNCVGLPLNNYFLLCGDPPQRLEDTGWEGTVENYVKKTVAAGRGAIMPAWSSEYGGPMRPDQVQNVVNYVLNWESEELCAQEPITYDWPESVTEFQEREEIAAGDPERGMTVYQANACNSCHGQPETPGSAAVGPWLGEIGTVGATRIEGVGAQQYVYDSILHPNNFIVPECPTGPCAEPSAMLATFAFNLSLNPQDMADLLAYLLGDAYQYP